MADNLLRRTSLPLKDDSRKYTALDCNEPQNSKPSAQTVLQVKVNAKKRRKCTVALIILVVVILAIVISGICSMAVRKTGEESKSLTELLREAAIFPTGSYFKQIDLFSPGPTGDEPRTISKEDLSSWGFNITSTGITGYNRRLRFYIWLPPTATINTVADASANDAQKLTALLSSLTGSVGLQYDDSCSITIVPLSLIGNPHSGMRTVRAMPDNSFVYELSVEVPENLCFTNATRSPCNVASWQVYSVHGFSASPAPRPVPCQVFDGQRAALHCRAGSCNRCRNILDRSYYSNNELFCNGCC